MGQKVRRTGRSEHSSCSIKAGSSDVLPRGLHVAGANQRHRLYQQERLYELLFDAAAESSRTIAADRKHLGARIGATLVLHTWGSQLTHHPYAHGPWAASETASITRAMASGAL